MYVTKQKLIIDRECYSNIALVLHSFPALSEMPYTPMPEISISCTGILRQLLDLKISKASVVGVEEASRPKGRYLR